MHDGQRWLKGAAAMVYDTVSFHVTLQSMAKFRPSPGFELPKVRLFFIFSSVIHWRCFFVLDVTIILTTCVHADHFSVRLNAKCVRDA